MAIWYSTAPRLRSNDSHCGLMPSTMTKFYQSAVFICSRGPRLDSSCSIELYKKFNSLLTIPQTCALLLQALEVEQQCAAHDQQHTAVVALSPSFHLDTWYFFHHTCCCFLNAFDKSNKNCINIISDEHKGNKKVRSAMATAVPKINWTSCMYNRFSVAI